MDGKTQRFSEGATGRCAAVASNGIAYVVATDPNCADGIVAQTQGALDELDRLLEKAGSGKHRMVQATVYLSDISAKPKMDSVWIPWIGSEENWPQRACVGVGLDKECLIEIVVTAELI